MHAINQNSVQSDLFCINLQYRLPILIRKLLYI